MANDPDYTSRRSWLGKPESGVVGNRVVRGGADMPGGILGREPLRPSLSVPSPVISPSVKAALAKYPEQKQKVLDVVKSKQKGW